MPIEVAVPIISVVTLVMFGMGFWAGRAAGWRSGYDEALDIWRPRASARLEVQEDENERTDPRL